MSKVVIVFYLVFLLHLFGGLRSETCKNIKGLEGCACRWTNSSKVTSLQVLTYNETVKDRRRFTIDSKDTHWNFAFNPCGSFNLFKEPDDCTDTVVGRYTPTGSVKQCFNLGVSTDSLFETDTSLSDRIVSNLTVTYRYKPTSRAAVISLICNSTMAAEKSEFKYINVTEGVTQTYYFSLESPCACPGGCANHPPPTTTKPHTTTPHTTTPHTTTPKASAVWLSSSLHTIVLSLVGIVSYLNF